MDTASLPLEIETANSPQKMKTANSPQKMETSSCHEKVKKKGIIYLASVPPFMNVAVARKLLSEYGEVGRIFFQPCQRDKKKKTGKMFTEGWIEFERKKIAKQIVPLLNNKRMENSKKSKFYDFLWNIKYLPRFKWTHLSERLAYERSVRKYKERSEIAQAKRESNFLSHQLEKSAKLFKGKVNADEEEPLNVVINQRELKEEGITDSVAGEPNRSKFLLKTFIDC